MEEPCFQSKCWVADCEDVFEEDHETCTANDGNGHLGLVHHDHQDGVHWAG